MTASTIFTQTVNLRSAPAQVIDPLIATGLVSLSAISLQCGIILDTITRQHRENYELNILRYEQIESIGK